MPPVVGIIERIEKLWVSNLQNDLTATTVGCRKRTAICARSSIAEARFLRIFTFQRYKLDIPGISEIRY